MNAFRLTGFSALALVAASLSTGNALADQTWNFSGNNAANTAQAAENVYTGNGCVRTANAGNTFKCDQGPSNTPVSATLTGWGTSTATSSFAAAYLNNQGGNGLGLAATGEDASQSPYHAFDSVGSNELVRIQFSKAISLNAVTIGWSTGDSDFSVLAWTGLGTPTDASITGYTATGLGAVGTGWTLVGRYGDVDAGTTATETANDSDRTVLINSGKISSSYWLIGAFSASGTGLGADNVPDAWKLLSVNGAQAVPEPSSALLVAIAAIGAASTTRRYKRKTA